MPYLYVLATESANSDITSALTTSFTSVASDIKGGISAVLPIALGIVGTVMVITFGIKIFKKLTNKAN